MIRRPPRSTLFPTRRSSDLYHINYPAMSQYFTLFQLEPAFDIDAESLEQTYRVLVARFHPDKFASASAFEQKQAVMMSSTINDAYRTLRNPIDRAAYLLKTLGIDADAPEHTSFAPSLYRRTSGERIRNSSSAVRRRSSAHALNSAVLAEMRGALVELRMSGTGKRIPRR